MSFVRTSMLALPRVCLMTRFLESYSATSLKWFVWCAWYVIGNKCPRNADEGVGCTDIRSPTGVRHQSLSFSSPKINFLGIIIKTENNDHDNDHTKRNRQHFFC